MRGSALGIITILWSLNASIAVAQASPAKTTRLPVQRQLPPSSFDMDLKQLSPNYAGLNADVVYDAAKKGLTNSAQSEFESTMEYSARLEALSKKQFWGMMKPDNEFAFVLGQVSKQAIPVSGENRGGLSGYIETQYDAETQQMTVDIPMESTSSVGWVSLWNRVQTHIGSFVGENGFGARRTVNRLAVKDSDLVITDTEWLDYDCKREFDSESCTFASDSQQARTLSKNVRVIVVGRLTAPFTSSDNGVFQPTTENPAEIHTSYRFLHIKLDELLIVNNLTGEIIRKYSRETHASEYPVNVEFRLRKDASFSDARCEQYAYDFPTSSISVDYSADGAEFKYFIEIVKDLKVSAHHYVDVSITYCNIPRIEVLLNGKPYDLQCEEQKQYIANPSKCNRIQLAP